MKYVLSWALLFLATTVLAQQQGPSSPTTNPPYQTPPTFPEERQAPGQQMPPDTPAPPAETSQRVEGKILDQFNSESTLAGTNIDAQVDDDSVVLTGSVDNMSQHDLAVRIAESNAGSRKIVDKIEVKQLT